MHYMVKKKKKPKKRIPRQFLRGHDLYLSGMPGGNLLVCNSSFHLWLPEYKQSEGHNYSDESIHLVTTLCMTLFTCRQLHVGYLRHHGLCICIVGNGVCIYAQRKIAIESSSLAREPLSLYSYTTFH